MPTIHRAACRRLLSPGQKLSPPKHRRSREANSRVAILGQILAGIRPLALIGILAVGSVAEGLAEELGRGAPALQVTNWVRGEPVELKRHESNRVHVVVFWETWCDSCLASLPQLVDLQTTLRARGVELLGVSPEPPEVVKAFLANSEIGARINFAIACDAGRKTFESYMTAFGQSQIPRAFVVDQAGALVWYGHPLAGLEFVVQQIVAGKFDLVSARRTLGAEKLREDYFRRAATNAAAAEVAQLGRQILADGAGNPWFLNNFAWQILQDPRLAKRDAELALQASKSACAATAWQRPAFLDTHALALFSKGEVAEAIRVEKDALALSTNAVLRARLEQTLKTFESGRTNSVGR